MGAFPYEGLDDVHRLGSAAVQACNAGPNGIDPEYQRAILSYRDEFAMNGVSVEGLVFDFVQANRTIQYLKRCGAQSQK